MTASSPSVSPFPAGTLVALIGHPNVGKSVIFQKLTGQRVTVSNYPGTTVEISRGTVRTLPGVELVDTPGVITLPARSEDEMVTAHVLMDHSLAAILQVGDAKNLRRTLLLTVFLAEMGRPLILALNMMDEAAVRGVKIDHAQLSQALHLPVIPTTAIKGTGVDQLATEIQTVQPTHFHINYPAPIEGAISHLIPLLPASPVSSRSLALLLLANDPVARKWLEGKIEAGTFEQVEMVCRQAQLAYVHPLAEVIQNHRLDFVETIAQIVLLDSGTSQRTLGSVLGRLSIHPAWGFLVLISVLAAMFWFVGVFGAGMLVDLLEGELFGNHINPWVVGLVEWWIPVPWLADFLVGEFGLWTMGMTYSMALILPVVTTFFLSFGLLEDSGYLPRLAAFSNQLFRKLGLNGKAVLPMVLGLGCVTMATLTTRILESRRERVLVTLLLALAIPCSAQLGVVMGLLAGISLTATLIWTGVVVLVFLLVGWLAAKLTPGERTALMVELPLMRLPQASNVLIKTAARLEWYIKEVVPLFLLGSAILFILDRLGWLVILEQALDPLVVKWLGLPVEASQAFLMGFMRRDFGATGLFLLENQGLLTPRQAVVAMVTVTLFVPCVASVIMIAKERGRATAIAITAIVFPLAFFFSGLLNFALSAIGWGG